MELLNFQGLLKGGLRLQKPVDAGLDGPFGRLLFVAGLIFAWC